MVNPWGMSNVSFLLYGSSIMEGRIGASSVMDRWYNIFHSLLSNHYPAHCFSIINSAVGGESTREIMQRFSTDVLPYKADYCLFMVGGNNHDCLRPERILKDGELSELLADFVKKLPETTIPIGIVFNPIVDKWHFATKHPAYKDYLSQFNGSLDESMQQERDLARSFYKEHNWPYLDLYELMLPNIENYLLPEDGVHLNPAGHRLFAEKMFELMIEIGIRSKVQGPKSKVQSPRSKVQGPKSKVQGPRSKVQGPKSRNNLQLRTSN